jgi:RNA polymerase-binding transcription factor DksA
VADEIDMANDQVQKQLELTMRTVNTEIKKNDTGECIWCGEPIKEKDNRRWCSVECRDEHERHS